jgi:hypothetical protein
MDAAESNWDREDYVQAFSQAQDLQKLLEAHRQKGATPFQKALYLTVHKRTVLIKHLITLDKARQNSTRRLFIRSQAKEVAKDAIQLKDAMVKLRTVKADRPAQVKLRDYWLEKCQNTLDRIKAGVRRQRGG